MTYSMVSKLKLSNNGLMRVSNFNPKLGGNKPEKEIQMEYQLLGDLFNTQIVEQNLYIDNALNDRNRYSDIITYHQTRVKLSNGVSKHEPQSDYINACFVNSPFPTGNGLGDSKVIAT